MPALAICRDLPPRELRRLARFEPDRRASMRLLAVVNSLPSGLTGGAGGHVASGGGTAGRDGAAGAARRGDPLQRRRTCGAARPAALGAAGGTVRRPAGCLCSC